MTDENTGFGDLFDESRRSFMKKGALASSAAALGLGSGTAVGQQDGQQVGTALVFVNDFQPGVPFEVVSRLQQPTVDQILGGQDDGGVTDPTDYNGYITNYTECGPGNYNLVFLREGTLQQDQTHSFQMDATFFSNQLQLLEVQLGGDGDGGGGNETDGGNSS